MQHKQGRPYTRHTRGDVRAVDLEPAHRDVKE
jgi:hypothetical protein